MTLPESTTSDADWPTRRKKRPVILIHRAEVDRIDRSGSRILVKAHGEIYKLGLKLFGRSRALSAIKELGWEF
jgi:anti-anti-sigma regulatory factor